MKAHDEGEAGGDPRVCDHYKNAMPYALEIEDPDPDKKASRKQLWHYMASQEYTCVSPEMQEEFLIKYQIPFAERYGLVAYGCCEDLTHKIKSLKAIPNLRRIAVSPFAKLEESAAEIGTDYVISYRPSPADMVSYDFSPERIKRILKRDLAICKGLHFDITLKDVETVERDPQRIAKWVALVKECLLESGIPAEI